VLQRAGVDLHRVRFFRFTTDRGWTRDIGPMFILKGGERPALAVNDFRFNGWSKYPNCKRDARVHGKAARALGVRMFQPVAGTRPLVLEGGAIDVNGRGTLMTTEECLLDQKIQVRNPGVDRAGIERALREWLGVTTILWLGGGIAGDDTHGHVDDVARFVNASTIVLCDEPNRSDENYRPLQENRERLQDARLEDGSRPEVVRIPMPSPLHFDGIRLPASYANFYISNTNVLVPTFNDPHDRHALGLFAELFPDRSVVGIHAVDLVWGLGTLHCLTQQQPAP
jgi:agmatine deiminase